jgi:anti-sigma B factor antagonist
MATFDLAHHTDAERGETLVVAGEIDLVTAHDLLAAGTAWVEAHAPQSARMDLGGVTFIDSTGISALLGIRRAAEAAGTSVELVASSAPVDRVLDLAGIADLFG